MCIAFVTVYSSAHMNQTVDATYVMSCAPSLYSWLGKSPQAPSHWPAGTNFKLLHGDRLGSKVFRTVVKGGEGASWWPYRSKTKFI